MNRSITLLSAIAFAFASIGAQSAEDHSAHRQHREQHSQPGEQMQHHDHAAHEAQMQKDEHAGREAHPSQVNEHAGHETAPPSQEADHSTHADHAQHDKHSMQGHGEQEEPTESELRHVPPLPPENPLGNMPKERMVELMQMEDTAPVGMVVVDQLEWREIDDADAILWDGHAWYGNDYDKAWFKAEGERVDGEYEGRTELLWDRIVSSWWSVQAGVRYDFSEGPSRTWAAFGLQGLAPYWFEVEATLYAGEEGRIAARAAVEYDLLLTQRLILQPEIELNLYGKDDPANGIGSGFSDVEAALRLRYEIRRELAPYIGIAWTRLYGGTAKLARAAGEDEDDLQFIAGLRVWF